MEIEDVLYGRKFEARFKEWMEKLQKNAYIAVK